MSSSTKDILVQNVKAWLKVDKEMKTLQNQLKENKKKKITDVLNKEKQNMEIVFSFKRTFYDINNREALESEIIDNLKDKIDISILIKVIEQINKNNNALILPSLPSSHNSHSSHSSHSSHNDLSKQLIGSIFAQQNPLTQIPII